MALNFLRIYGSFKAFVAI